MIRLPRSIVSGALAALILGATISASRLPADAQSWLGVLAPARTPAAIVEGLNTDINASLNTPAVSASMATLGFIRTSATTSEFAQFLIADVKRWSEIVAKSGVQTN